MKKTLSSLSKENKTIILTILVLTLVFGFNDGKQTLTLESWLSNLIYVLFISIVSFLAMVLGYKLAAKRYNARAEIDIAGIQNFGLRQSSQLKKRIPLGIILALVLMLLSSGKMFFTAIASVKTSANRIGHRFHNITFFEEAVVAGAGITMVFILLLIFKALNLQQGVTVTLWLIIWNLLPFGNLAGGKMFIGSRTLYILAIAFFVFVFLLLPVLPSILSVILAVIFASAIAIFYFKKVEMS